MGNVYTFEQAALEAEVANECFSHDPFAYESEAEDEVCRNARRLVDFLDAMVGKEELHPWQASTPACFIDFTRLDTGLLLCLVIDAGQPKDTRIGASDELRERYLKAQADEVAEVAQRMAGEAS